MKAFGRPRRRSVPFAAATLVSLAGLIVGAEASRPAPLTSTRAEAAAPNASVCNGMSSFCGAVLRIESANGTIGSVAAGAHYGPAWGIPATPNDSTGTGWCVDDTHTGFPAGTIVELPTPAEWRPRQRRVAATIISLFGGDRVLPYQPLPIDRSGELADAEAPSASPTQLRHVAVWLALRSVLVDPAGTPRIDLASAQAFADRAGRVPSPIGNAAVPIARRMVEIAEATTPIGGDPVVTVEAADGTPPTAPGTPEELLVRVTDPSGRPLPHLPVWPDRRTNIDLVSESSSEFDEAIVEQNAALAGWPSFDTSTSRDDVALTDSQGVARFSAEVIEPELWSASFTTETAVFRLRLLGDDLRAQNNVTLRDDEPTLSANAIDGDARLGYVRVVKTSSDPDFGVAGAQFAVIDRADGEIERATTGTTGAVEFSIDRGIHPPPYRVREVAAPAGLAAIGHDIDVTTPDGSISTDPDHPTLVYVVNEPIPHELTIQKRVVGAVPNSDDLAGFSFTIARRGTTPPVATLITDAAGRTPVLPLPAGEYDVTETARPTWWPGEQPLPDPIEVSVPVDAGEPLVIEFENRYPTTTTTLAPTPAPVPTTPPPPLPTTTTTTTTTPPSTTTTTTTTTTVVAPDTIPPATTVPPTPPPAEPQLPRTGGESWRVWYRAGSLLLLTGSVLYAAPTFWLDRTATRPHSRSRRSRSRRSGRIATGHGDGRAS